MYAGRVARRASVTLYLVMVVACGSSDRQTPLGAGGVGASGAGGSAPSALSLTSGVFHDGDTIPAEYRCAAPSPDLAWAGGPTDTASYSIVFQDVTPGISNGFLHWVLFDVPGSVHALPKGVAIGYAPSEPAGAHQAPIWNGTQGFNGPCGGMNTYELTLRALDVATLPGIDESSSGPDAVTAIRAHELAHATMTVHSAP